MRIHRSENPGRRRRQPSTTERTVSCLVALILVLGAESVNATDGVIEINQAKILANGGFPFIINQPGSYRLTSDLDLTVLGLPASKDTIAILVGLVPYVSIDLNGFAIRGPADCTSGCINQGIGSGIQAASGLPAISIRNGKVIGAGYDGLRIQAGYAHVEDMILMNNGNAGIEMNAGVVSRTVVAYNGGVGIDAYDAAITDCYASNNVSYQLRITFGTIENCAVETTAGAPIRIFKGILRGTQVKTSAGIALECTTECAITGNKFSECSGAACLTVGGVLLQIPPASNMCGGVVCP